MGTNQFQTEYIEYLQERNTELLNRLNNLKENYENKILAKNLSKHYLISVLEDVLNVCTAIPQEIDLFFDKMTAAMGAFKNILLRKSEMMQLVEKISKVINPTENISSDLISVDGSDLIKEQISEGRVERKGTVRVSPMINGHIISTEPRIYLSRVPGVFTPGRKSRTHQLSPIIEASPDPSLNSSNIGNHVFREIKIPLERINLNKLSYNYNTEDSPKSRFKGPKTWKKSLSSNKHKSDCQKNTVFLESGENLDKKFSIGIELPELPENIDPLEGPSWLHEEISELNSSSSRFIDYRRRKHRFATVFDKNEDCITYFEEKSKKSEEDSDEFYDNHEEDDDEKNSEGSEKRVSESSVDFICESFISECEDNNSFKRRKCGRIRRVRTKESNDKNYIQFVKDIKKEFINSKNEKGISTVSTPTLLNSPNDEDIEKNSAQQSKENRKRPLKSLSNKNSGELSFEKIPSRTELIEQESQIGKTSRNKRVKNTSVNQTLGNVVKSGNRVFTKQFMPETLKQSSPIVKQKTKKSRSGSKSRSPEVFLPENEGRKRRKAAPSFKLVEPKLKTKLRRS